MKYNKFFIHKFLLIQGFFLIILQGFFLHAAPTCKNLSIHYGSTPKINHNSWVTLSCYLANPDTESEDIGIRLIDNVSGAYRQRTIFSNKITVPPGSSLYYQTVAMVENSEEYNLELFDKGKRIGKTTSTLIKLASRKSKPLPVFNDSSDINFGSFIQIDALKDLYHLSLFSANTPFTRWPMLINSPFIIILRPDFASFSSEKFQSLISYVKQGGTIIFADPDGLQDAEKTPLAALLPLKVLKKRKIKELPALRRVIPGFKSFSKSVNFLESIPNGNGITLLKSGEFPLIRYKKFGMGGVRAITVPASSNFYRSKTEWKDLICYLFSHQQLFNNTDSVKDALDEMTGFTIPGIESIRWIIFLYFLIIAIPLGLGLYFKRTASGWITGGILAILFSLTLLYTALSGTGVRSKDFLSFIEIVTPGGNFTSGIGYYGIMSASDKTIDIKADYDNVLFSDIPPSEIKILYAGNESTSNPPLEVQTENGRPRIKALNLPVNSQRHFFASFQKKNYSQQTFTFPQLHSNGQEFSLEPWNIPKEFTTPQAAWIQFPSGRIDLNIKARTLLAKKETGLFHSDVIIQKIKKFTAEDVKHSSPILYLLEEADKTSIFSLKNSIIHGKRLIAIPVSQTFNSDKIAIHPEEISLIPGDSSTKLIMSGNNIKPEIFARSKGAYLFKLQLPPYITNLTPQLLECDFSYINDSGNIKVEPFLLARKEHKKKGSAASLNDVESLYRRMYGEKGKNGIFIFSKMNGVINSNSAFIGLRIKIKNINIPLGAQKKTNTWRIEKFRITIKGTLPGIKENFIY
jgi:hypothetical protein